MKVNKTITLDIELVTELAKLHINVSEECNIHLWTLINKNETKAEQTRDLTKEIKDLTNKKAQIDKEAALESSRKAAGISDKCLLFLKAMNTNYACAKDNMMAWQNLTGEKLTTGELRSLKEQWT